MLDAGPDHVANRDFLIEQLRRELVGPSPEGPEVDVSGHPIPIEAGRLYAPCKQKATGEEILVRDSPTRRYGIGVLFPPRAPLDETGTPTSEPGDEEGPPIVTIDEGGSAESDEIAQFGAAEDSDEFDLSMANAYQPSSIGVSFLAELPEQSTLTVSVRGGRYFRKSAVEVGDDGRHSERDWWLRQPVSFSAEFPSADLLIPAAPRRLVAAPTPGIYLTGDAMNTRDMDLQVEVYSRPQAARQSLLTVCLVNRTAPPEHGAPNTQCLFQSFFTVRVASPDAAPHILPYPGPRLDQDEELESSAMLYRDVQVFATGHGCSADWQSKQGAERADSVSAESLPVVRTPNITPDINREDGSRLVVRMASLAGLIPGDDGRAKLEEIVTRYERWISESRRAADEPAFDPRFRRAANRHLGECERAARRMRDGLEYLDRDPVAREAFRLASHAILLQQVVTRDSPRQVSYDSVRHQLTFEGQYREPEPLAPPAGRGDWRPFQIAFLLASIKSSAEGDAEDRDVVELIWFPTGGGKTEAYLGLAAFAIFKRRLERRSDPGVDVLMRYTLRLLTAQQFQRASGLICAMEYLRRATANELGTMPFTIGIWLGSDTTPNTRENAVKALDQLERSRFARHPFVLGRCPWCGAQFRRVEISGRGRAGHGSTGLTPGFARYREPDWTGPTVQLTCPDPTCPFANGLPVYVIDEDIYEFRPTLVIGTIDKFAMLTWRPQARALFGLDKDGRRIAAPPGLIIQDELHLIAGPLGSLAGLYETVIERLCTVEVEARRVRPKIVSSTATIRRYREQIRGLYARSDVALFPPPGIDAADSFFARYERERPGKAYVGIHAVSLGSVQTEWVRTFTTLLQAPAVLDAPARDPWWTLLVFFNSIREMGTAHTLFESDVPDYSKVLWERHGTPRESRRYRRREVLELTGGLRSEDIMGAMADLDVATTANGRKPPVDVCLASSIIEVGIDIPRLSLIVVAGQPKTTSQYIQVTGRVGRLRERPGLVVTMYSPSKPRDRSHFERFRAYHERLYASVEPTSVTPFSPPTLERALHAALTAYVRQTGDSDIGARPWPFPSDLVEEFRAIALERVSIVDSSEAANLAQSLARREGEWKAWHRTRWDGTARQEDVPLLRLAGSYASAEQKDLSWATLMSMRNVDAECEAEITTHYIRD